MRKEVEEKREERPEAGGRGGEGGEGRADRCTGRRRIDLVWRIIFRLDHHLIPPPYMETAQVRRLSSSVPRARSRAPVATPKPNLASPRATTRSHPQLFSSKSSSTRVQGGWGTSRVRPGPGTHTGTWNESRLLQSVHVCTPPLVTKPHASCNACVHSDYNSRSPRRPTAVYVYV